MALYVKDARKMFHSRIRHDVEKSLKKIGEVVGVFGDLKKQLTSEDFRQLLLKIRSSLVEIDTHLYCVQTMGNKEGGKYFPDPEFIWIPQNEETIKIFDEMLGQLEGEEKKRMKMFFVPELEEE